MNELICLDMPAGPEFVDHINRAWDSGDAIFPLDQRFPDALRQRVLASIAPSVVVSSTGERTKIKGKPVESGDAVVIATSGTTGEPRGVVLTHNAVQASAQATNNRIGIRDSDAWLACLPLSHVGGLSVVLRAIISGTAVTIAPTFSDDVYQESAEQGCTLVSLVATALQRVDASIYRKIILGGSSMPADLPDNVITTYGLTETGSGVVYDRRPLDGVEVRIVDDEIQLRCAMMLRQYRDGASALTPDGWLSTGDLGSFEQGILHVNGRKTDLIVTGGENVWPDAIEQSLRTCALVQDVCVTGTDNPEWGQVVTAWVVSGSDRPTLKQIRNHVKETLPAFCAPRLLYFVNEIPRTSLGKPIRSLLMVD